MGAKWEPVIGHPVMVTFTLPGKNAIFLKEPILNNISWARKMLPAVKYARTLFHPCLLTLKLKERIGEEIDNNKIEELNNNRLEK